ncbi:hypothetical protein GCM10025781_26490 [Kocuria gwangalliensis]|uniref:Uncharacterized protein n=1 Tax=Kocuria gwangalliensis TaxID=501592 RepID=A0ABP8XFP2_9MICC
MFVVRLRSERPFIKWSRILLGHLNFSSPKGALCQRSADGEFRAARERAVEHLRLPEQVHERERSPAEITENEGEGQQRR